ncbi:MAG: hypothetical protein KGI73_01560 [Patescibacteria group bacterium]|nr:hypothetical protein [Patescibacteria group bacterium]
MERFPLEIQPRELVSYGGATYRVVQEFKNGRVGYVHLRPTDSQSESSAVEVGDKTVHRSSIERLHAFAWAGVPGLAVAGFFG